MPRWQRALYGFYERMLSPWMDCMLVLSRHEAAEAQTLGIPPSKIRLIHNAIPPMRLADRDALRRAQKLTESDVVAGFVGRFSAQKNPQLAILAFAQAAQDCPTLHLWMIGDGPLRSDCENLATQLGIAHRVTWHGAVEAADFYAGMDMLLITSRYEGMAYTYLEALAAGLPILSTDVGGADSCVVEGQTGHILPTRAADFAEKMVLLCHDAPLRDAMHFAARGLSGRFLMGPDYCHQLLSVALR
jgi:glycosyltransferase involved in cell wall biosynthesis